MANITFVGATRFSVVNTYSNRFQVFRNREASFDEIRHAIFSDDRLRSRFELFEALTLPSLAALAETQSDFHHAILFSPDMPIKWLDRLSDICRPHSWVQIVPVPFERSVSSTNLNFLKRLKVKEQRVFSFRLDDDDALASNYCSAVQAAVSSVPDGTVISFETGFLVKRLVNNRFIISSKRRTQPSAGIGVISSTAERREIHTMGNHRTVRAATPRSGPMWLRSIHTTNDSPSGVGHWWSWRYSAEMAARKMQPWFHGVDLKEALQQIPATEGFSRAGRKLPVLAPMTTIE